MTVAAPQVLSQRTEAGSAAGLGDIGVRVKWRFFRRDVLGGVYHAAVIAGLEFPTGQARRHLGSGTHDVLLGAAVGYEGRRWLWFASARHRRNGRVLLLSAGVWFTYRNHAFKPGIQLPVYTSLEGVQERPDWRLVLAYEIHLDGVLRR